MPAEHYIRETSSTNELAWSLIRNEHIPEGSIVWTDFQTTGKGQPGNSWESEDAQNLLFSIVLYPTKIRPEQQFILSQLVSIAIKKVLDRYCDGITIKWPNDIYWENKKIGGILIENSLQGKHLRFSVLGIGLNVNQTSFVSDAPNPVSLRQILGKSIDRMSVQQQIYEGIMQLYRRLDMPTIQEQYSEMLYRKTGIFFYNDGSKNFGASIKRVHPDGRLELETGDGECLCYYFKEVSFVIE